MRTALIDGTRSLSEAPQLRQALLESLAHVGCEVEDFPLRELRVSECLGCFGCWVKTPGECVLDDDGRRIVQAVVRSELLVFLTPITFGGYSSVLKRAVDRLIPVGLPFFRKYGGEIHHPPRYARSKALLAVGAEGTGASEAGEVFRRLVERNARNLHAACAAVVAREGEPHVSALLGEALRILGRKP
jgi:multimeric flavodoxin WrbA